jgi:hypothetical protein
LCQPYFSPESSLSNNPFETTLLKKSLTEKPINDMIGVIATLFSKGLVETRWKTINLWIIIASLFKRV